MTLIKWLAQCLVYSRCPSLHGLLGQLNGKETACNAGDTCLIPGSGRSSGDGIGYPLQYSWASLVAQIVKNPPAMREAQVRSLDWADPLEGHMATHSSTLACRMPWTEEPDGLHPVRLKRVRHARATEYTSLYVFQFNTNLIK